MLAIEHFAELAYPVHKLLLGLGIFEVAHTDEQLAVAIVIRDGQHREQAGIVRAQQVKQGARRAGLVGQFYRKLQAAQASAGNVYHGLEHVVVRNDAYKLAGVIHHGQPANLVVQHDQGGLLDSVGGFDGDGLGRHNVFGFQLGQQIVHFVHVERGGLGGRGIAHVAVRDNANDLTLFVHNRNAADVVILHELAHFEQRCIGANADNIGGHPVLYRHAFPPGGYVSGYDGVVETAMHSFYIYQCAITAQVCSYKLREQSKFEGADMFLHLDCGAGISGPMTLAALAHLGVDFAPLTRLLALVGLPCQIDVAATTRPGGPGQTVAARWLDAAQHPGSLKEFAEILDKIDLPHRVRQRAYAVASALAGAYAQAGQMPVDAVRFATPESWGETSGERDDEARVLMYIIGAAYGLEVLGVQRITASALPWFSGSVSGSHGCIPLPRPATACLLQGKPVFATETRDELITPTGAALLHALVDEFVPGPQGTLKALGTGYGLQSPAGGLRAWLVEQAGGGADHAHGGCEPVIQLESHIDHLNGEDLGMALSALSSMPEVLDVLWLPGLGKKNRPAGLLRVLCLPGQRQCVAAAVLRHTHTLGLRVQTLDRMVAPRRATTTEVAGQMLPAKEYVIEGQTYIRPEADALEAAARQQGVGVPALRNARG